LLSTKKCAVITWAKAISSKLIGLLILNRLRSDKVLSMSYFAHKNKGIKG
jgi:hypothetical protein